MTPEHWQRLRSLFEVAILRPENERRAYLDVQCGDDTALLGEVMRMLESDRDVSSAQADLHGFAEQAFADEHDLYLGRTFGPYLFKERLAVGGMSWIYLAERTDYGSTVAIKVLRDPMATPRRELFEYEKRLLAQMKHPSIAQLHDAGTLDDGSAFFVMEFVDGLHITEYCQRHHLDLRGRLSLFRQICDAVRYAHGRGVIHRDLKPSNILVQEDGTAKLLDFGVSGEVGSGGESTPSSSYMTLAYAAPEQIRHEGAEVPADVYSLGVVLQQLITGRLPFSLAGKTTDEIRAIILKEPPYVPSHVIGERAEHADRAKPEADSEIDHGIWPVSLSRMDWADLDHICAKALVKAPKDRYGSVESLVRDLDLFQQRQPLEDFRPHNWYVPMRFLQRNRRPVLLAGAVACLVALLIGFYTYRLTKARDAALAEAARTDRVEKFMEQLLTGGDANNGPSAELRVVSLLENGVRDARALNSDPPIQATLYELLGGLYGTMGNFEVAEPLFQSAFDEQTRLYGADSVQIADTLASWGFMRRSGGKTGDAEKMVRQAVAIDERRLPASALQALQAHVALGIILIDRGAYAEAVPILDAAVTHASANKAARYELSAAMSNLGNAEVYMGDLDRAAGLLGQSLDLDRQLKGDTNIDIAEDLMTLADIDERLGRLHQAEQKERRALSIEQHWYNDADQPEIASAMTILAQTLSKENRAQEALPLAQASLAMRQRLHAAPSYGYAHAWNALGQIEMALGDLDAAEKDQTMALTVYRQFLPSPSYQAGVCLDSLSVISFERKQYDKADDQSREALQMLKATLPADSDKIATAEAHYGRSLQAQHQLREAKEQYLDADGIFSRHKDLHAEDLKRLSGYLSSVLGEEEQISNR